MWTEFDASRLRAQDQYSRWIDVLGRLYCRATGTRQDSLKFEAQLERCELGAVDVSDLRCSAMRYDRARLDQRQDDRDDFLISLLMQGRGQLEQQGRLAQLAPGDLVLFDTARPYVYAFPEPYRFLLVRIPRQTLLSRLPNAERMTGITMETQSPLANLAATFVQRAASLDIPRDQTASNQVGGSLVDVLCAAIQTALATSHDRDTSLLKRAKEYMRAHLEDQALDVEGVAKAVHASPRTLSRAFASSGTTVIRWLWQERLAVGRAALLEGRAAQIGALASSCGFSNGSHFSRLFKSAYGVLPHTLLRRSAREA